MIRIGVIGYGYWGPNIVRNLSRLADVDISWVCDMNPKTTTEIHHLYPKIQVTKDYHEVYRDPATQAIIIATPTATHFALASQALKAGKHVLIEKPMTQKPGEARLLVRLAKKKKKILMVDHTFIYTPAIRELKKLLEKKELGSVFYVESVRTNLGLLQKDSNVIYDLAAHDFSIMDYLFKASPRTIIATGITQQEINQETVAHIAAEYGKNLSIHFQVSWLSPIKIRRIIVVGTKKMAVYDDMEQSEKLKIYDKGVSFIKDPKATYQMRIGYRSGTAVVPHIPIEEGLYGMVQEFVSSITYKRTPITDGAMGARVVSCLQAATDSMRHKSKIIRISAK